MFGFGHVVLECSRFAPIGNPAAHSNLRKPQNQLPAEGRSPVEMNCSPLRARLRVIGSLLMACASSSLKSALARKRLKQRVLSFISAHRQLPAGNRSLELLFLMSGLESLFATQWPS